MLRFWKNNTQVWQLQNIAIVYTVITRELIVLVATYTTIIEYILTVSHEVWGEHYATLLRYQYFDPYQYISTLVFWE